jgi:hypothetical protein
VWATAGIALKNVQGIIAGHLWQRDQAVIERVNAHPDPFFGLE